MQFKFDSFRILSSPSTFYPSSIGQSKKHVYKSYKEAAAFCKEIRLMFTKWEWTKWLSKMSNLHKFFWSEVSRSKNSYFVGKLHFNLAVLPKKKRCSSLQIMLLLLAYIWLKLCSEIKIKSFYCQNYAENVKKCGCSTTEQTYIFVVIQSAFLHFFLLS